MPRSNRPRRGGRPTRIPGAADPTVLGEARGPGAQRIDSHGGDEWVVRSITGQAATKSYRCPGCDQEIAPGVAHVVAWPLDGPVHRSPGDAGDAPDRRHWHTPCWAARARRRPQR